MELFGRTNAPKRADTWFVYALVDSRKPEEIRYIGITNDLRRRMGHHCSPSIEPHTRKSRWISKVLRDGGDILARIMKRDLSHASAKVHEVELIREYSGANLTNLTEGGDGTSGHKLSSAAKEKIASKRRGNALSEETKIKLRLANTGRASPNKGTSLSPEWRAKIGAGLRERYKDPIERAKTAESVSRRYANVSERERTAIATRRAGPPKNNKSGFKGVSFCKQTGRWVAQIKISLPRHLGRFPTPEEAARAYDRAAYAAWGSDCYLNFPADVAA